MHSESKNLEAKRHSLAHLLAAALMEIYPKIKLAIGPAIDDGFYYDFETQDIVSIDDLQKIEDKMRSIGKTWSKFEEMVVSKEDALQQFKGNPYKTELIEQFTSEGKQLTTYKSGDFIDLCGGGHVDDFKKINLNAFCLKSIAGAYWRGDENNKMLSRVYGLAFDTEEELEIHKEMLEKAKEIDHRKIGKELGLFSFSPLVGPGLPLFTPKGTALRMAVEKAISILLDKYEYERVWIPHIAKKDLYKKSGHWGKFGHELFKVSGKHEDFILKPMNCPHHTQIYANTPKSYNDLPVRYAEFTTVYRDEQKGELLGLSRVMGLTQDDGHIFCTTEQLEGEISNTISLIIEFYTALGFFKDDNDCEIHISVRGEDKEKYLGVDTTWDLAENILQKSLEKNNLNYIIEEGEAAFYGPKIDFQFKDSLNRKWQLATIQLDFVMPDRFNLKYIDTNNKKQTPVMIHRAISGSIERFLAIMIEHFAGNFPFFLSPIQSRILPITKDEIEYSKEVLKSLKNAEIRCDIDMSTESIGRKIAKSYSDKIPSKIVIGKNEVKDKTITLDFKGEKQTIKIEECIELLKKENDIIA